MMELTKTQQEFIGSTFLTSKGTEVSVIGISKGIDKRGKWDGKFILHCSSCSKDEDLWPCGSLTSPKGSLKKGIFPCACATGKPRYTERQDIIVTNREITNILPNIKVTGVDTSGSSKKYILECKVCSTDKELWPNGSIASVKGSLLRGYQPCGCAPSREYSDKQDLIRVQRVLDKNLPKLKVLCSEKIKGTHKHYLLECSVCSKDTELWPKGSIRSVLGSLRAGLSPCGCSRTPRWTEDQYKVLVSRKAESLGVEVFSFWEDFKGRSSRLVVSYGEVCKDSILQYFLTYKTKDTLFFPRIGATEKLRTPSGDVLKMAKASGLTFETLRYLDVKGTSMEYTCSTCSTDTYVKNGFCSGKFKTSLEQVKSKNRSCRCSPTYRWTKSQRECTLKGLMSAGEKFLYWSGLSESGLLTSSSVINWECAEGHHNRTNQDNFIGKGSRCRRCYFKYQKSVGYCNGYYPERAEEDDNLYVIAFHKDQTIKVGRAFDIEVRLKGAGTGLLKISEHSLEDITILYILKGSHQEVYDTEQWVHEELTERGFHASWIPWTTECFTEDSKDVIKLLLDESVLTYG